MGGKSPDRIACSLNASHRGARGREKFFAQKKQICSDSCQCSSADHTASKLRCSLPSASLSVLLGFLWSLHGERLSTWILKYFHYSHFLLAQVKTWCRAVIYSPLSLTEAGKFIRLVCKLVIKTVSGHANKWQAQDINTNNKNIFNQLDVNNNLYYIQLPNKKCYSHCELLWFPFFPFLSSGRRKKKNAYWQFILSVILPVFIAM